MTMNDTLALAVAGIAGIALGLIFFGGLWWTVRAAFASRQPALWFFSSLLLRMAIVLTGFYLIGVGNWQRLLACLAGFVVGRLIVTLSMRPEVIHAP